jgi:hypothetical protein
MLVPRKANYGPRRSEMNDDGSLQSVPLPIQKAGGVRGSWVTYLDLSASDLDLWPADQRLTPNPTSRRDHSDLLRFHFFNQNEIRIELIAERAALASIYVAPRCTKTGLLPRY